MESKEIKEEIEKRLKAKFSKKEIIAFLKNKGYSENEIENEFPKLNRNNNLYMFVLTISILISLSALGLTIFFGHILAPLGIIILTLCFGTYLIFKLKKAGFIIHIIFYALLVFGLVLAYMFYEDEALLSSLFSLKYFIPLMAFFIFMITSLNKLLKKI